LAQRVRAEREQKAASVQAQDRALQESRK